MKCALSIRYSIFFISCSIFTWSCSRVARQSSAKASTPVRIRSGPQERDRVMRSLFLWITETGRKFLKLIESACKKPFKLFEGLFFLYLRINKQDLTCVLKYLFSGVSHRLYFIVTFFYGFFLRHDKLPCFRIDISIRSQRFIVCFQCGVFAIFT